MLLMFLLSNCMQENIWVRNLLFL